MIRAANSFRVLPLLLAMGLTACSSDMSDLHAYIAEVHARKSSNIEPIPEPEEYVAYTYQPADRRDPFTPPQRAARPRSAAGSGPQPDLNRPREPLEEFPIDGLKMVGTIGLSNNIKALVQSSDGNVHTVRTGNYLGRNDGKVLKITSNEIFIRELIPDGFGGYQEREISLFVRDEASQ